jgi:hypothetical protein
MFTISAVPRQATWHSEKGVKTYQDFEHNSHQIPSTARRVVLKLFSFGLLRSVQMSSAEALLNLLVNRSFEGRVECSSILYPFSQLLRKSGDWMGYALGNLSQSFPDFLPPESQQDANR